MQLKKIQKKGCEWFHLSDGKNIIYCEPLKYELGYYKISSVHKPCRECGTGFQLAEYERLTEKSVSNCLQVFAPNWATEKEIKVIKKYSSIDEFLKDDFRKDSVVSEITIN
jgi:hypothetical protein